MKHNLFNVDIAYRVIPERKVVIAYFASKPTLSTEEKVPIIKNLDENFYLYFESLRTFINYNDDLQSLKAVAKCSDSDEFNIVFGKKLAKARLLTKLYRACFDFIDIKKKNLHIHANQLAQLKNFFTARKESLRSTIINLYDRVDD